MDSLHTVARSILLANLGLIGIVLGAYACHLGRRTKYRVYAFDFALGAGLTTLAYFLISGRRMHEYAFLDNLANADNDALMLGIAAAVLWATASFVFIAATMNAGAAFTYWVSAALWSSIGAGIPLLMRIGLNPIASLAVLMTTASAAIGVFAYVCRLRGFNQRTNSSWISARRLFRGFSTKSPEAGDLALPLLAGLLWAAFLALAQQSRDIKPDGLSLESIGFLTGLAVFFGGIGTCWYIVQAKRKPLRDLVMGPIHSRLEGLASGILSTSGAIAILISAQFDSAMFDAPFWGALLWFTVGANSPRAFKGRLPLAGIVVVLQVAAIVVLAISFL